MIITKNIPPTIKPRRGDIYFTPSGLGYRSFMHFYNLSTPSGLGVVRQLDALRAETQKLEALYQQKIFNLEELKKSILQLALSPVEGKAFNGEPDQPKTEKSRRDEKIIEKW